MKFFRNKRTLIILRIHHAYLYTKYDKKWQVYIVYVGSKNIKIVFLVECIAEIYITKVFQQGEEKNGIAAVYLKYILKSWRLVSGMSSIFQSLSFTPD